MSSLNQITPVYDAIAATVADVDPKVIKGMILADGGSVTFTMPSGAQMSWEGPAVLPIVPASIGVVAGGVFLAKR